MTPQPPDAREAAPLQAQAEALRPWVRAEGMDDYVLAHIDPEDPYLHALRRAAHLHLLYPRMVTGPLQGSLLRMLVRMVRPRLALEVGTYSGYSALCIARALPPGAVLHTFERNDELEPFLRRWLLGSPYADRIRLHLGDALTLIPALDLRPDLIYIDSDKRSYAEAYRLLLPLLQPGGYLLADNTLWDGHVLEPHPRDPQTIGVQTFNDLIAHDPRVERVILPFRDGLTIVRKREEGE